MLPVFKKVTSYSKKVFILFFVFALIITLFTAFWSKPENTQKITAQEYNRARIYSAINNIDTSTESGKAYVSLYRTITCISIGEACTDNPTDGDKKFNSSIFGGLSNLLAFPLVNPPASGVEYVYNGLNNAGLVPNTYAAEGIGFAAIKPLTPVWKIFRDIAYLVVVIVMVVIGFMIMFRSKLDAQTVVSVENSLPKIVISLLLITFSFAIAGFLIDMMYLVMAIAISALADPLTVGRLQNEYLAATPAQIIDGAIAIKVVDTDTPSIWANIVRIAPLPWKIADTLIMVSSTTYSILSILPGIVQTALSLVGGIGTILTTEKILNLTKELTSTTEDVGAFTIQIGNLISGAINSVSMVMWFVLGFFLAVPLIMMMLIFFTVLYLFFRVFAMLLSSYIKILLLIIFGPLYMLVEAIPGQSTASTWFKNLVGELMSFPIVAVLLIVANRLGTVMLNTIGQSTSRDLGDIPNALQFFSPPFLYGLNQEAYAFLVSMGIVFIIPDIVKVCKEFIGVSESPLKFGIGTFFAGGTVAASGAMGLLQQFSSLQQSFFGDNVGIAKAIGGFGKNRGKPPKVGPAPEQSE